VEPVDLAEPVLHNCARQLLRRHSQGVADRQPVQRTECVAAFPVTVDGIVVYTTRRLVARSGP
jgi:hypothetical protein